MAKIQVWDSDSSLGHLSREAANFGCCKSADSSRQLANRSETSRPFGVFRCFLGLMCDSN